MEEMHRARYWEGSEILCLFWMYQFPWISILHQPRHSLNAVLLGFYEGFITQARLGKPWPLVIDLTSNLSLCHFPEVRRWDWKFQPSNHVVGSLGNQPASLGSTWKLPPSHHLGNSKGFSSSVSEMGTRIKYILFIINHIITRHLHKVQM